MCEKHCEEEEGRKGGREEVEDRKERQGKGKVGGIVRGKRRSQVNECKRNGREREWEVGGNQVQSLSFILSSPSLPSSIPPSLPP